MNKTKILIYIFLGVVVVVTATKIYYRRASNSVLTLKNEATVEINNHSWQVEVVETPEEKSIGLSKISSIAANQGMLFFFTKSDKYSFWMKNMKFNIDIVWIQDNLIVDTSSNLDYHDQTTLYTPQTAIDMVLELPAGAIKETILKIGDRITLNSQ